MLKRAQTILVAVCFVSALSTARADWSWTLDAERYQRMPVRERAEYRRGRDLFHDSQFRAAAAVFDRFIAQFPDSAELPYLIFLRGYAYHQASDRNTAIKSYNEVLDYFGHVIEAAAPALYWLGVAEMENGDDRSGLSALKEMVEDEDYRQHELAAGALRRLADNYARNNEPREAVRYWRQAVDDFGERNRGEAEEALENLMRYAVMNREVDSLMDWWVDPARASDPAYRKGLADRLARFAWGLFYHQHGKLTEEKNAWLKAYAEQKRWYEASGDPWSYYASAMSFRARHKLDDAALSDDAAAYAAGLDDAAERDAKYASLSGWLAEGGSFEKASLIASRIADPAAMRFAAARVLGAEGKFEDACRLYEEIESMAGEDDVARARGSRANLYRERLGRQEEAIKLYTQLANPPHNLWMIADCYVRWGKIDDAVRTLTEIENSFPDQAARAAWSKAHHYDRAAMKDEAVSAARRVLKLYPKSRESSEAHQLLEKYGIKTGGGLLE